jgi:hypothetical protein
MWRHNISARASLVQISTEWLRPSSWIANDDTPQTGLDVDANRLVLLDRAERWVQPSKKKSSSESSESDNDEAV